MDIHKFQSVSGEEELVYAYKKDELLNECGEMVRAEGLAHHEPQGKKLAEASFLRIQTRIVLLD